MPGYGKRKDSVMVTVKQIKCRSFSRVGKVGPGDI